MRRRYRTAIILFFLVSSGFSDVGNRSLRFGIGNYYSSDGEYSDKFASSLLPSISLQYFSDNVPTWFIPKNTGAFLQYSFKYFKGSSKNSYLQNGVSVYRNQIISVGGYSGSDIFLDCHVKLSLGLSFFIYDQITKDQFGNEFFSADARGIGGLVFGIPIEKQISDRFAISIDPNYYLSFLSLMGGLDLQFSVVFKFDANNPREKLNDSETESEEEDQE